MQAESHLMESPRESPHPCVSGPATADGHANALLIRRLYASLQARDHVEAAKCYADDASFEDIAFRLGNKDDIALMWRLVCGRLRGLEIGEVAADASVGVGTWVPRYPPLIGGEGKPDVVNPTTSVFRFREGRIVEHRDFCDPVAWARQAFPFPIDRVMGRVGFMRRLLARLKLRRGRRDPE